jgi:hypothetical protein
VFFLHFKNVTDVEFFDLHKQLLLSGSEVAYSQFAAAN